MSIYATQADFEAYVDGWVTDNPTLLQRELDRAESDVNWFLKWRRDPYTAPAFVLLPEDYRIGLRDAVCAQTEYRLTMGPEFWVEQPTPVAGPDYTTQKAPPTFGPKAREALLRNGIISRTGTMGARVPRVTSERRFTV